MCEKYRYLKNACGRQRPWHKGELAARRLPSLVLRLATRDMIHCKGGLAFHFTSKDLASRSELASICPPSRPLFKMVAYISSMPIQAATNKILSISMTEFLIADIPIVNSFFVSILAKIPEAISQSMRLFKARFAACTSPVDKSTQTFPGPADEGHTSSLESIAKGWVGWAARFPHGDGPLKSWRALVATS